MRGIWITQIACEIDTDPGSRDLRSGLNVGTTGEENSRLMDDVHPNKITGSSNCIIGKGPQNLVLSHLN